jgi:ubiquinone/menaquinone biosynthesis C-methylase UbiE
VNHEKLAQLLRCPACGSEMQYRSRVYSYRCEGKVLHTYRIKGEIADLVNGATGKRQTKVEQAFSRVAGGFYERNVTGATGFDRFANQVMWGTTRFIPLLFELLESVASDCDPGYFLDIPVGTGVFTASDYSLLPNFEFIAVDYSRQMLETALERVRAEAFGNVMLVRADAARLPFADDMFSGILTMNGIGSFDDSRGALDELTRVLKPGGKIGGSIYARGERFLTDVVVGRMGKWTGHFTPPYFTDEQFVSELEARGINKIVTRKVKSILFFSGRKCSAENGPAEDAVVEDTAEEAADAITGSSPE